MPLNIVDLFIVLSLVLYVLIHIREGFFPLTQKLAAFLGGLTLAFLLYQVLSSFLELRLKFFPGLLDATSFVVLFVIFQSLIYFGLEKLLVRLPVEAVRSSWNRILAVIPALVDGAISVAIVLFVLVILPFLPGVKNPIEESFLGSAMVSQVSALEGHVNQVFGRAAEEALSFATVSSKSEESLTLPFKPTEMKVDEESEKKMLELVNEERKKVGLKPLILDESLVVVARAHSFDMWQRQYFAHEDPDGKTPFDRMEDGEVSFKRAGENLALARTVLRAHEGLMNSEGHKRNILDSNFGRIGIGVVDGGIYGKMFTQDFAD